MKETLEPTKKGEHNITFKKGGLHKSTHTKAGKDISGKKMEEAESGKFGKKAEKQANFAKNVLTGKKSLKKTFKSKKIKKLMTSDGYMVRK